MWKGINLIFIFFKIQHCNRGKRGVFCDGCGAFTRAYEHFACDCGINCKPPSYSAYRFRGGTWWRKSVGFTIARSKPGKIQANSDRILAQVSLAIWMRPWGNQHAVSREAGVDGPVQSSRGWRAQFLVCWMAALSRHVLGLIAWRLWSKQTEVRKNAHNANQLAASFGPWWIPWRATAAPSALIWFA